MLSFSTVAAFFKAIPIQVYLTVAGVIVALIVLWRIDVAIQNHLKYVKSLETQNAAYQKANTDLNATVVRLSAINQQNEAVYQVGLQQAKDATTVANQERDDAQVRAAQYGRIRNAVQQTPPSARRPVDPVIQSAVNQLWDPPQAAPGH